MDTFALIMTLSQFSSICKLLSLKQPRLMPFPTQEWISTKSTSTSLQTPSLHTAIVIATNLWKRGMSGCLKSWLQQFPYVLIIEAISQSGSHRQHLASSENWSLYNANWNLNHRLHYETKREVSKTWWPQRSTKISCYTKKVFFNLDNLARSKDTYAIFVGLIPYRPEFAIKTQQLTRTKRRAFFLIFSSVVSFRNLTTMKINVLPNLPKYLRSWKTKRWNQRPNFSNDNIKNLLQNLNPQKACGPDNLANIMLNKYTESLANSLSVIFRTFYSKRCFPTFWKKLEVTPIFKDTDRSLVKKYRPISLLCNKSKVWEKMIEITIAEIFLPKVDPCQYGFVPKRSTFLQLLAYTDEIYRTLDSQTKFLATVYIDFAKSLDKLDHKRTLEAFTLTWNSK